MYYDEKWLKLSLCYQINMCIMVCVKMFSYCVIFCSTNGTNLTVADILKEHFIGYPELENANSEVYNNIHVRRNHIWSDTLRAVKKHHLIQSILCM